MGDAVRTSVRPGWRKSRSRDEAAYRPASLDQTDLCDTLQINLGRIPPLRRRQSIKMHHLQAPTCVIPHLTTRPPPSLPTKSLRQTTSRRTSSIPRLLSQCSISPHAITLDLAALTSLPTLTPPTNSTTQLRTPRRSTLHPSNTIPLELPSTQSTSMEVTHLR